MPPEQQGAWFAGLRLLAELLKTEEVQNESEKKQRNGSRHGSRPGAGKDSAAVANNSSMVQIEDLVDGLPVG